MTSVLDNVNILKQKDPEGALDVAAHQYQQAEFDAVVWHKEHDNRELKNIVVTGMGGSALSALLAKVLLLGTENLRVKRRFAITCPVAQDFTLSV